MKRLLLIFFIILSLCPSSHATLVKYDIELLVENIYFADPTEFIPPELHLSTLGYEAGSIIAGWFTLNEDKIPVDVLGEIYASSASEFDALGASGQFTFPGTGQNLFLESLWILHGFGHYDIERLDFRQKSGTSV